MSRSGQALSPNSLNKALQKNMKSRLANNGNESTGWYPGLISAGKEVPLPENDAFCEAAVNVFV